jgi:dienelactone hydrolase
MMRSLGIVLSILLTAPAHTAAAEVVTFAGDEVTLQAFLYRPAGPGPFPAVVALHGCAGLYGRDASLSPRHVAWAERLTAKGFAVLFPDSLARAAPPHSAARMSASPAPRASGWQMRSPPRPTCSRGGT